MGILYSQLIIPETILNVQQRILAVVLEEIFLKNIDEIKVNITPY